MSLALSRQHLFEFNDLSFTPAALRDSIVESLGNTLAWGHILAGLVEPLEACLAAAGCREVLDLGSGAGRPAAILADEFRRRGHQCPRFLLTDLHPRPHEWAALRAARPEVLDFVTESVDATQVPAEHSRGRVRTLINILHHLPPEVARTVIADACQHGEGVFIAEAFGRNPLGFLTMWPTGLPALLLNPVLTSRDRLAKIALTWLSPTMLSVGLWDGLVSTLRIHTPADLQAMAASLGDGFEWHTGHFEFLAGGRGDWFWVTRRR